MDTNYEKYISIPTDNGLLYWNLLPYEISRLWVFSSKPLHLRYTIEFLIFLNWRVVCKWFDVFIMRIVGDLLVIPLPVWRKITPTIEKKFNFRSIIGQKTFVATSQIDLKRTQKFKKLAYQSTVSWVVPDNLLENHSDVEGLTFIGPRLQSVVLERLSYMPKLRRLSLSECWIDDNDLATKLTNLTSLTLDSKKFSVDKNFLNILSNLTILRVTQLFNFTTLVNLSKLHLSLSITEFGSLDIEGLTNLHTLDIEYNGEGPLNRYCFGEVYTKFVSSVNAMQGLCKLRMAFTSTQPVMLSSIFEPITPKLYSLKNLSTLDISNNPIFNDSHLSTLTQLTELHLVENYHILDISMLTNLKVLNLRSNLNIMNWSIKHLTNITDLNLEKTNFITDKGLEMLYNIRRLNIAHSGVTGHYVSRLSNLTSLDITHNNSVNLDQLTHLYNLRKLDIYNCQYSVIFSYITTLTNLIDIKFYHESTHKKNCEFFRLCHLNRK